VEDSDERKVCSHHSGIVSDLSHGDRLMQKFEVYMEVQTKRMYTLMVGIILCLLTGFVSIYISSVTNPRLTYASFLDMSVYAHTLPVEDIYTHTIYP